MKKTFKQMLLLFLALTLTAGAAACQGSTGEADSSAVKSTAAESTGTSAAVDAQTDYAGVKFRIAWWGSEERATNTTEIIKEFEKKYPNLTIDVEYTSFNDYWVKLSTQAAGKEMPDVIQMDYSQISSFSENNQLLALEDVIADGRLDVSKVEPALLEAGKVGGKLYGISTGINAPCLVYNDAVLKEAGVEISQNPTMEEIATISKTVYETTNVKAYYNDIVEMRELYFRSIGKKMYSDDGKSVGYTPEELAGYWSYILTGLEEGYFVNPIDLDSFSENTKDNFDNRIFWMNPTTSNQAPQNQGEQEVSLTCLPIADNAAEKNATYIKPAMLWSITQTSQQPELAADFISYFVNDTGVYDISGNDRGVPISGEVREYLSEKASNIDLKVYELLNYLSEEGNSTPLNLSAPSAGTEATTVYTDAFEKVFYQTVPQADLLSLAQETIEKMNASLSA